MPRRFQFSLRALLVAMLVVSAFLGGIHVERERRRRQNAAAWFADVTTVQHGVQTVRVRLADAPPFDGGGVQKLVRAVESRIETTTPYKVVDKSLEADSELAITVASQSKFQSSNQDGTVSITIKWVDKQGTQLQRPLSLRLARSLDEEMVSRLSQKIVTPLESPW